MNQHLTDVDVPSAAPSPPAVWERLDPRYVTMERQVGALWTLSMAAFWLAVFIAVVMLSPMPERYRVPLFTVWAIAGIVRASWAWYRPAIVYRHSSFRLDGEEIE